MKKAINCFIPFENEQSTQSTVASLRQNERVNRIYLLASSTEKKEFAGCPIIEIDTPNSTETLQKIASAADTPLTLLYTKTSPLVLGYRALERMTDYLIEDKTTLIYSDHYEQKDGELIPHPVIDYQLGSVRDDFDFGSVLLFDSKTLKEGVLDLENQENYHYAALYALRLFASHQGTICHINEYLYTEVEEDLRLSGEKQFDYVNPRNREVQIEMEKAFTHYLKETETYLAPHFIQPDFNAEGFEVEASVIIPVKNRVKTIKDAIDSVLSQETDFPFNLLIVDNHSTDGTSEAIESYQGHSQVIHIRPERKDLGIGGCWSLAANHPQCGRFAVQLDSDDIYSSPHTLQKIVNGFHEQKCAMLVGSYRITDFNLNTLPPGIIDHKEWTEENGHNNALRINGLGAPRAFYTPILREIGIPNVSYGEDYALGLAFSRSYKIGRIYEELYLCRRWKGNSDAALSIEKVNRNNHYKDSLRTREMLIRSQLHSTTRFIESQLSTWELARKNHQALSDVETREILVDGIPFTVQFNPSRIHSTGAKLDTQSIQQRPCFLCRENQPTEQKAIMISDEYHLCVNPYPILPGHVTIPFIKHIPQQLPFGTSPTLEELFQDLPEGYAIFYNGAQSGASAPDHIHFQAVPQCYIPLISQYHQWEYTKDEIDEDVYYIDDYICPLFSIEWTDQHREDALETILEFLPKTKGELEPKLNLLAWKEGEKYIIVIIPRKKHRPDCYFAEGDSQLMVSPGALDMAGIIVTPRKEDFDKITADDIRNIIQEVGCSPKTALKVTLNY